MDLYRAYSELLKLSLLDLLSPMTTRAVQQADGSVLFEEVPESDRGERLVGRDWPANGMTMVGKARLDNLERCIEDVLAGDVPGDIIETGVWRGGATIFARALLRLHDLDDRHVWVADSFQGLPPPDEETYAADRADPHHTFGFLSVSLDQVRTNFERHGLLDDQVRFLPGWFRDTLPGLRDETWSVIRLDGDMYESTMIALESLYPQLSAGGYIIVDDYGALPTCRQAVDDYRAANAIDEPIEPIDWTGVHWRKRA